MYDELSSIGFQTDNLDLQRIKNGILIHILERDNRFHVMIEVDENATVDNLRAAIPLACKWRDRVMKFQGAWDRGGDNEALEKLLMMHDSEEISYRELAKNVNQNVVDLLKEYLAYRAEVESLFPKIFTQEFEKDIYFDIFPTGIKNNPFSSQHARYLLKIFGLSDEEIQLELKEGIENLHLDKKPFPPERPISQAKMISTLRVWRDGKEHKSIQEKQKKDFEELAKKYPHLRERQKFIDNGFRKG